MVLQHNIAAMNAQRQFNINNVKIRKSTEKLSSGYRVNRAADDAAALAISEKMRRQIRGLTQSVMNTQDGVSMCQVGDGALSEVHDMLNRITELSVQAANGSLNADDRQYIQQEINELVKEVDRIGDTTTFNGIPLFHGSFTEVKAPDGTPIKENDYTFSDVKIADITLNDNPINTTSGSTLALSAKVENADSYANGRTFNLIFGNGSTSNSKLNIRTTNGVLEVDLSQLSSGPTSYDASAQTVSRDFRIVDAAKGIDVTLTQTIGTTSSDTEKAYQLSYSVKNNSTTDISVDFLFHADTAYNNDDYKDNYFVNGSQITKYTVYGDPATSIGDVAQNTNVKQPVPTSLSLVDKDNALPFTEYFAWDEMIPSVVCVGQYARIGEWDFYNQASLNSLPSTNALKADLGFSVIWDGRVVAAGSDQDFKLTYGLKALSADTNVQGNNIQVSDKKLMKHSPQSEIWIQSGSEANVGMYIHFGEMNSQKLGIKKCDVTTQANARASIDKVKKAMRYVSELRSTIGAEQSRLEHTIANENNIIENTTAAESQIRDTDMAQEMMQNSLMSILSQAGIAMMAQANQSNQAVLSLLQ